MILGNSESEDFVDPIYESISVGKGTPRVIRVGSNNQSDIDYRSIVKSPEFSRLAFLRQAGVVWLVFPSATHTRFAHSIGTYWLGYLALTNVRIKSEIAHTDSVQLGQWLGTNNLKDEFLVALLLHDVGHLPLSHTLEGNDDLLDSFKYVSKKYGTEIDLSTHEERGYTIINGIGPIYERLIKTFKSNQFSNITGSNTVKSILDQRGNLCKPAIGYSITGNESYLKGCNHDHLVDIDVIKEFVSGLFDLDRMDHLSRDAYFSSIKSSASPAIAIFRGLEILPNENGERGKLEWYLTRSAVSHALSLLFDRKMLYSVIFHNQQVICLNAMINFSLSYHLRSFESPDERGNEAIKISIMGDDEFIQHLSNSKDMTAKSLARLYSNRVFYNQLTRIDGTLIPNSIRPKIDKILTELNQNFRNKLKPSNDLPFMIWKIDEVVKNRHGTNVSSDWLSSSKFLVREANGNSHYMINDSEFGNDFGVLKDYHDRGYVHIFLNPECSNINVNAIKTEVLDVLKVNS
jgi:HD superfamily phosphohydrolase